MNSKRKINIKQNKLAIPTLVANELRGKILTGEYTGGHQLKQDYLAQQYDVSISVIREALKILEGENLVSFSPNHGATVTELSPQEAINIFEIRILLEVKAMEKSIEYFDADLIKRGKAILKEEKTCQDAKRYNELNSQFHELLYEKCGNPQLLEAVERLHNSVNRYLVFYLDNMDYKGISEDEHKDILAACIEKDTKKAKQLLKTHLAHAGKCLAKFLER